MSTVAAISTAPGASAINIVRITGDNATEVADKVFSANGITSLKKAAHSKMYLGTTVDGKEKCLAVCFFAPKSYTGEDLIEIHCHGGFYSAEKVLSSCIAAGAAPADKGEFTKRAFLNGKMTLSDAEAVADMIHAESSAALTAALNLADGRLSKEIKSIIHDLETVLAELEASLDYPDEMAEQANGSAGVYLASITKKLTNLCSTYSTGRLLKHGIKVAIVGLPNSGKSSLLNAILGKERAIVTDIPGTTRDIIEDKTELDGVAVYFMDTAGIRDTDGQIEQIGIEKALDAAKRADLVIFVTEAGRELNNEENRILKGLFPPNVSHETPLVIVKNKADLVKDTSKHLKISAKYRQGIDALLKAVADYANSEKTDGSALIITSKRHYDALLRAKTAAERALGALSSLPAEYLIEDLRETYYALGEITGDTATENIINTVFERFCLGK